MSPSTQFWKHLQGRSCTLCRFPCRAKQHSPLSAVLTHSRTNHFVLSRFDPRRFNFGATKRHKPETSVGGNRNWRKAPSFVFFCFPTYFLFASKLNFQFSLTHNLVASYSAPIQHDRFRAGLGRHPVTLSRSHRTSPSRHPLHGLPAPLFLGSPARPPPTRPPEAVAGTC